MKQQCVAPGVDGGGLGGVKYGGVRYGVYHGVRYGGSMFLHTHKRSFPHVVMHDTDMHT